MRENIRASFRGIWSHKMRSFLTMLGVIIGIAAIIAIVSTIKGTNDQIMKNLIGAGNNCVNISLQQGGSEYWMDSGLPDGVSVISEDQISRIRALDTVQDASFFLKRSYADSIMSGDKLLDAASVMGIDLHYLDTTGLVVYKGRPISEEDIKGWKKVVLVDEAAANLLYPDGGAVGSVLEIRGEPFTVIGLVRKDKSSQPVIQTFQDYITYHQEEFGRVYMPDVCWPMVYQYDEPQNCVVRARETELMSRAGKEAENIMSESVLNAEGGISYKAEDLLEKARNKQELSNSTNSLLIWIASIALLVGGIGVMNIMLVSVTERTNEIGLKKALGARKKVILLQFLTESAMLTSMGGVLGVISGIVLAKVISGVTDTPMAISLPAIVLGVAFSMIIGIVFGLLPSIKAANLNPIDALRRE